MTTPRKENIDRVVAVIQTGAITVPNIVRQSGVSQPCVRDVFDHLRAHKLVHLAEWQTVNVGTVTRWIAAYRYGDGVDAPKPATQSDDQRRAQQRTYRKKYAETQIAKAEAARLERIRKELDRPAFRDPLVAALFGEYQRAA